MKNVILSLLVDNSSGVLTRVTSMIGRRGFNIDSLAVGETASSADVSRMTIAVTCDEQTLQQLVSQLQKLVPVRKVVVFYNGEAKSRELILVKVKASKKNRSEIMEIANLFQATIVEATQSTIMLEFTGDLDKEQAFMAMLKEHEILELVRTGLIAMQRGNSSIYDQ